MPGLEGVGIRLQEVPSFLIFLDFLDALVCALVENSQRIIKLRFSLRKDE